MRWWDPPLQQYRHEDQSVDQPDERKQDNHDDGNDDDDCASLAAVPVTLAACVTVAVEVITVAFAIAAAAAAAPSLVLGGRGRLVPPPRTAVAGATVSCEYHMRSHSKGTQGTLASQYRRHHTT
jgi:hypothetical protein